MDDIQDRLEAAVKDCKEGYSAWRANIKDTAAREKLMEYAHELRRIAARLEIELAVAERNVTRETPIPIPPHRAAGRRDQVAQAPAEAVDDGAPVKPRKIADGLKLRRTEKTLNLPVQDDDAGDDA